MKEAGSYAGVLPREAYEHRQSVKGCELRAQEIYIHLPRPVHESLFVPVNLPSLTSISSLCRHYATISSAIGCFVRSTICDLTWRNTSGRTMRNFERIVFLLCALRTATHG